MQRFVLTLMIAVSSPCGLLASFAPQLPDPLPRPDGKSADMRKPVQVYILMGQSNMLGFGKVSGLADACKNKDLYPYLIDDDGKWTVRKDVRYVRVMCSGNGPSKVHNNEWMTIGRGNIGPEMGIGHYVGHVTKAPVLILKSCIGNRSLGYDLLPPTAEGYAGDPGPSRKPKSGGWYAGIQYDGDVTAAKKVLSSLGKYYPGAKRYEVAGFFWWQGDKDFRSAEHAASYEKNLLCLIESLRKDFKAPNAKFVCATLGQTRKNAGGPQGQILQAQLNIDGARGKYKAHKGKVASVYSNPLSKGGSSSGHYGGNAETYMNVGQAMGQAMAKMIMSSPTGIPGIDIDELDASLKRVYKSLVARRWSRADKSLQAYLDSAGNRDGDQLVLAMALNEYLTGAVDEFVGRMREYFESGDYCELRDGLAKEGKNFEGVLAFDKQQGAWVAALASEKAVAEMAIGDQFKVLVAKKKRAKQGDFFKLIVDFQDKYPDSFYATKAEAEIAPIRVALRDTMQKISARDRLGDLHGKYELIKESKTDFGKIPEFGEASKQWADEAKSAEVKAVLAIGSAYAKVFSDLAKLDERLAKEKAKAKKIRNRGKREKAEKKAMDNYLKKLEGLADRLATMESKHAGTYYGRAANRSLQSYIDSNGKKLTDEREK